MSTKRTSNGRESMLQINQRQRDFYESRFEAAQVSRTEPERAANAITNVWNNMRARLVDLRRAVDIDEHVYQLHRTWMSDLKDARVLDLGCFAGNALSLWIAEQCADYTGIDLSEQAITELNAKLRERALPHARAYAQDFLTNNYPDNHFDLVYAWSVLHHFQDMPTFLQELQRILKPGGMIISFDPMMTEPFNRLARVLYRPFQSDRAWEWPFTLRTFRLIQQYFEITDMHGLLGMVKLGFPFMLSSKLERIGQRIGRWGVGFDNTHAREFGPAFYFCWQTTLRLRKPQ